MFCWSDLNGILRCHKRASPLTVKNIKIENTEKYKEKNKQHRENKKTKYKKEETLGKKNKYDENNLKYREKTEKQ